MLARHSRRHEYPTLRRPSDCCFHGPWRSRSTIRSSRPSRCTDSIVIDFYINYDVQDISDVLVIGLHSLSRRGIDAATLCDAQQEPPEPQLLLVEAPRSAPDALILLGDPYRLHFHDEAVIDYGHHPVSATGRTSPDLSELASMTPLLQPQEPLEERANHAPTVPLATRPPHRPALADVPCIPSNDRDPSPHDILFVGSAADGADDAPHATAQTNTTTPPTVLSSAHNARAHPPRFRQQPTSCPPAPNPSTSPMPTLTLSLRP
jgi:hypothetical protein